MESSFPSIPDENFQLFVYEHFARIAKAFASPYRLMLLNMLSNGEHTVEEMAKAKNMTVSNVSRHLAQLKSANLVHSKRVGKFRVYFVPDERTKQIIQEFREFGQLKLAEIQATMQIIEKAPTRRNCVCKEELLTGLAENRFLVLDVRPESEYNAAHLPGATSMPIDELQSRYKELDCSKTIAIYCRDIYCTLADRAVEFLRSLGFDARRTDMTVQDWAKLQSLE